MSNKTNNKETTAGSGNAPYEVAFDEAKTIPSSVAPPPADDLPAANAAADEQTPGGEIDDRDGTTPLQPLIDELAPTTPLVGPVAPGRAPVVQAAQRCHVGAVRLRNEDSALVYNSAAGGQFPLLQFGLYIVADGMGGHFAGHEASKRASRLVAAHVLQEIYLPLLQEKEGAGQRPVQEIMLEAVQQANQEIHNPNPYKDTGTTLTAAVILGRRLYLAHVGDSRAYLLRDHRLQLLTTDHSYVQRLQDAGQLTPEAAAAHPQRNVLYRAVGQGGELEVDVSTLALPVEGELLLCSDGLWGVVPETILVDILEDDALSLEQKADQLVTQALHHGGHDNITAVVVAFAF